eukprot:748060-Hanusia_phi.AAC.7
METSNLGGLAPVLLRARLLPLPPTSRCLQVPCPAMTFVLLVPSSLHHESRSHHLIAAHRFRLQGSIAGSLQ